MLFLMGDIIERPGPFGKRHRGIFVGFDEYGRGWVIHNDMGGLFAGCCLKLLPLASP